MKATRLYEWLTELGYDPSFSEADAKMLYRANYVPIWDHLMERIRPAAESDMVRANLAANGVTVAGAAGGMGEREKAVLEEERRVLQQRVKEAEGRVAQQESEVRQLARELAVADAALQQERAAAGEERARGQIEEAMGRVLEASIQVYQEYGRRLAQETERLSCFGAAEEGEGDTELAARSQLVREQTEAAKRDERNARGMVWEEGGEGEDRVARMLYEMQRQHVAQFVETVEEERRGRQGSDGAGEDLALEAAQLRAALEALREAAERVSGERAMRLVAAQDARDAQQQLAGVQRELSSVQAQAEALVAAGSQERALLRQLSKEVAETTQDHVLALEDAFGPLAEQMRDSVAREYAQFASRPLAVLLRSSVSPQAAGLAPPLVRDLRIHAAAAIAAPTAAALGYAGAPDMDQLLEHLLSLALEVREGALSDHKREDRIGALEAELRQLREREEAAVTASVLPLLRRTEAAAQDVMERRAAVETALHEWTSLPAQLCVPDPDQRERFMRRYNYLRVLAHEAAKQSK